METINRRCDGARFDFAKIAFGIHQAGSTIEDSTGFTVQTARWLDILYPCLRKKVVGDGMPRCVLCGIAEEDQDWDFDEYRDETGVSYLCLNCIETY